MNTNKLILKTIFIVIWLYMPSGFAQIVWNCGTSTIPDTNYDHENFQLFYTNYFSQNKQILNVPVCFHIIRQSNGSGGVIYQHLQQQLVVMNQQYAGSNLSFYECSLPEYIDDDDLYEFEKNQMESQLLIHNTNNVLNIYYTHTVSVNPGSTVGGYSFFPWMANPHSHYIIIAQSNSVDNCTLSHEAGHYFGLLHTHETAYGVEFVNGANCETAGDQLCDTPADPNLLYCSNSSCQYTCTNNTDPNGQHYSPSMNNLMSYVYNGYPAACATTFTSQQNARILYYYQGYRSSLNCSVPCTYNISPGSASFSSNGGNGSINVTTPLVCNWTVVSNSLWVQIISGSSGTGNGVVTYHVDDNYSAAGRTGSISVAGFNFDVHQSGVDCDYSIYPPDNNLTWQGGNRTISISTSSECAWHVASSNPEWLHISSVEEGTGPGFVTYSVMPNNSPVTLTGNITVAGEVHTVSVTGLDCIVSVMPTVNYAINSQSSYTFVYSIAPICGYSIISSDPSWLHVNQVSNNVVYYTVDANPFCFSRIAYIYVNSAAIMIRQDPGSGIEENVIRTIFEIYPNPTHDQLNISGEGMKNGNYEITITDLLGQQLVKCKEEVINDKVSLIINIKQLPTGIYFLNIRSEKIGKTFKVEKM